MTRPDRPTLAVTLAPTALLRAAAWPVETLDEFAAPESAAHAAAVHGVQARVAGRRPELLRLLHDAVPRTEDVTARRRLLAIRRAVGRADAPYDESAHGIEAGPESAHPLVAAPESPPRPLVAAPESPPRLRGVAPEAVRLPGVAPVLARLL
ncbi:hypothetical protein, partial [Streptomyces sp. SID3343]|uniref:hypothetical protein n=1 Tax=Streptomyces sp. SID3343 TaxID=2690260 RepID=UPI0013C137F6